MLHKDKVVQGKQLKNGLNVHSSSWDFKTTVSHMFWERGDY